MLGIVESAFKYDLINTHTLPPQSKRACAQYLSCVWLSVTPWTLAHQVPLRMEFPRWEYWSGVLSPTPGIFLTQGSTPSFASALMAGGFFTTEPPGKPTNFHHPRSSNILDMTWNMNVAGSSQVALVVKNLLADTGDTGDKVSILELGRSPGGGNDNPLQYSCLENSMDRGVWRATVRGVTKSQTQMKRLSAHTHSWVWPCAH